MRARACRGRGAPGQRRGRHGEPPGRRCRAPPMLWGGHQRVLSRAALLFLKVTPLDGMGSGREGWQPGPCWRTDGHPHGEVDRHLRVPGDLGWGKPSAALREAPTHDDVQSRGLRVVRANR